MWSDILEPIRLEDAVAQELLAVLDGKHAGPSVALPREQRGLYLSL